MMKSKTMGGVEITPITQGPKHHFFGYYDKSPWDGTGNYILAMETDFIDRMPQSEDMATIGFVDQKKSYQFKEIAETRAWNWQQGCMLQWMPPDYKKYVIYNDKYEDSFVSVIQDVQTGAPVCKYSPHAASCRPAYGSTPTKGGNWSGLGGWRDGYIVSLLQ